MNIGNEQIMGFVERFADAVAEHRRLLTRLDSAIGDADHGENMHRGMKAALERLDGDTPADLLKAVAMALVSKVGGAAGPLYGTGFLRASKAVEGKDDLDGADLVAALDAAFAGVAQRGKSERGQKTMLDALGPAVDAMRAAVDDGRNLGDALRSAAEAADEGKRGTVPLIAQRGRASYLGERSIGHQDPGATSTAMLIACMTGDDALVATAAEDASDKEPEEGPGVDDA
ncbi:MAG TPA: dihydroxyacetone kinase subunit DhaL [Euzebyales bacterium]|nr:dihydroxyacetone kinase subunit DhaL [Euzebyales bacterium]